LVKIDSVLRETDGPPFKMAVFEVVLRNNGSKTLTEDRPAGRSNGEQD